MKIHKFLLYILPLTAIINAYGMDPVRPDNDVETVRENISRYIATEVPRLSPEEKLRIFSVVQSQVEGLAVSDLLLAFWTKAFGLFLQKMKPYPRPPVGELPEVKPWVSIVYTDSVSQSTVKTSSQIAPVTLSIVKRFFDKYSPQNIDPQVESFFGKSGKLLPKDGSPFAQWVAQIRDVDEHNNKAFEEIVEKIEGEDPVHKDFMFKGPWSRLNFDRLIAILRQNKLVTPNIETFLNAQLFTHPTGPANGVAAHLLSSSQAQLTAAQLGTLCNDINSATELSAQYYRLIEVLCGSLDIAQVKELMLAKKLPKRFMERRQKMLQGVTGDEYNNSQATAQEILSWLLPPHNNTPILNARCGILSAALLPNPGEFSQEFIDKLAALFRHHAGAETHKKEQERAEENKRKAKEVSELLLRAVINFAKNDVPVEGTQAEEQASSSLSSSEKQADEKLRTFRRRVTVGGEEFLQTFVVSTASDGRVHNVPDKSCVDARVARWENPKEVEKIFADPTSGYVSITEPFLQQVVVLEHTVDPRMYGFIKKHGFITHPGEDRATVLVPGVMHIQSMNNPAKKYSKTGTFEVAWDPKTRIIFHLFFNKKTPGELSSVIAEMMAALPEIAIPLQSPAPPVDRKGKGPMFPRQ